MDGCDEDSRATMEEEALPRVTASPSHFGLPIECNSLQELQNHLGQLLQSSSFALIPPLVTVSLYLNRNAKFEITRAMDSAAQTHSDCSRVENNHRENTAGRETADRERKQGVVSIIEVLGDSKDYKSRIRIQHAVARQIIAAITEVDGFCYGVRYEFESKKNGHRYTFACHDSGRSKERQKSIRAREKRQKRSNSGAAPARQRCTFHCLRV